MQSTNNVHLLVAMIRGLPLHHSGEVPHRVCVCVCARVLKCSTPEQLCQYGCDGPKCVHI